MSIERITQQQYQDFKPINTFFESECTADLPDESLVGMDKIMLKEPPVEVSAPLLNSYQSIDIYGYGFVKTSSVPL
jgi:hypothetical protein